MRDSRPLEPGEILEGRFRIEEVVGEGSFSTVYRATQRSLGRSVAIKWMKTQVEGPGGTCAQALDDLVERFRREARIIARLESPATVTLHDFGRTADHDFYMILEYVDGERLTELRGERLHPNRVVSLLEQALESLGEAHDHGIVHRDVKPDNLMVYDHRGKRDRLKILDFGIAKVLRALDDRTLRQITGESKLLGTPHYIAPENATDRDPGPPADLYSLGLIAYELLLGERPLSGDDPLDVLDRHLSSKFRPRIDRRPAVPEGLRRIVNRMIEKPVAARYATAEEVLEDLEALPDYADGFGRTGEMARPETASTPMESESNIGLATTESLPSVSAYGETPQLENIDRIDGRARTEKLAAAPEPSASAPHPIDAETDSEGRTARERPRPPAAREERSGGEPRRASVPPAKTYDVPDASDADVDADGSPDGAGRTAGFGLRLALGAALLLVAATLVALGLVAL